MTSNRLSYSNDTSNNVLKFSFEEISVTVYILTLLALLVDVGGGFGIKYIVSGLLLIWALVLIAEYGLKRYLIVELSILIFFLFSALNAVVRGVDVANIYGQLSFVVFFLMLIVAQQLPRYLAADLFHKTAVLGSLVIISTFLVILLFPITTVVINGLGETYRLGYLGVQKIDGLTVPSVYYRWSMWLIPAFILSVGRHNFAALVIGVAAVCTLSTSIISFTLFGALLLNVALRSPHAFSVKAVIGLFVLTLAAGMMSDAFLDNAGVLSEQVVSKFSSSSESSNIKLGHIQGVLQSLQESTLNLLFGTGPGSSFYSPGIGETTINIEPSHFNFVRQFGVLGGLIFFGYISYVIITGFRTDALGRRWSIGLLMLFIAAGTNPLLMSPVFVIVLIISRASTTRFYEEAASAS